MKKISKLAVFISFFLISTTAIASLLGSERKALSEDIAEFKKNNKMTDEQKALFNDSLQNRLKLGIANKAPKVGDTLADAEFTNHLGKKVKLSQVVGGKAAVITFYRGAWCPYCNLQLRSYQNRLQDFKNLGANLIAVSPQTPDNSLSTREKLTLGYTVLSDKNNNYARQVGIVYKLDEKLQRAYKKFGVDLSTNQGANSWELPLTATFVVDKNMKIQHAFVDADYTKREEPVVLLDVLIKLLRK